MRNRIKAGFTIVEMLMVVAVLAVLTGIVGTAASSAIRQARVKRADALRQIVEVGISTYYAQKGYWPPKGGKLQSLSDNGIDNGESVYTLTDGEADAVLREIVSVSVKGSSAVPVMDPSAMIVVNKGSAGKKNAYGQEFREAVKKHKKHGSTLTLNDMAFGYQESSRGYFRRFRIRFNGASDTVTVEKQ